MYALCRILETISDVCEMSQYVRAHVVKPDELRPISGTHIVERETWFCKAALWPHTCSMTYECMPTHRYVFYVHSMQFYVLPTCQSMKRLAPHSNATSFWEVESICKKWSTVWFPLLGILEQRKEIRQKVRTLGFFQSFKNMGEG